MGYVANYPKCAHLLDVSGVTDTLPVHYVRFLVLTSVATTTYHQIHVNLAVMLIVLR